MKRIKKAILPVVVAASLAYPNSVSAGYPVLDISNLYEAIVSNIQEMQNWAQEKMLSMAEMDLQSMLSSMGIDNQNNATTNLIVREGLKDQTIQNIEMTMHSVPDMDACKTIAQQVVEKESKRRANETKKDNLQKDRKKHSNFGLSSKAYAEQETASVAEKFGTCEALSEDGDVNNSLCSSGGLMLADGDSGLNTPNKNKAADAVIDLMVGVNSDFKKSGEMASDSAEYKEQILKEMRKESFRDLARVSLQEVKSQYASDGTVASPMQVLEKFSSDRYGNEQWLKDIANVDPDNKNAVYISEITRKMAVMDAFMVHLELIKYKQTLRMEALQAAMLSLEVNPLNE